MNEDKTPPSTSVGSTIAKTTTARKAKAKKAKAAKPKAKAKSGDGRLVPANLANYRKDAKNKTAGGNVSVDCDDKIAAQLRGKSIADVYATVSKKANVPAAELKRKYAKLNLGMQRMNLGNVLRGAL